MEEVSRCFDRGSVNPADDYYEANIRVQFKETPSSGTLEVAIDGKAYTFPSSALIGDSHLLERVAISADGDAPSLTAYFSIQPDLSLIHI